MKCFKTGFKEYLKRRKLLGLKSIGIKAFFKHNLTLMCLVYFKGLTSLYSMSHGNKKNHLKITFKKNLNRLFLKYI